MLYSTVDASFFLPLLPRSVTLVTAKKQHRCWNARTHACARDAIIFHQFRSLSSSSSSLYHPLTSFPSHIFLSPSFSHLLSHTFCFAQPAACSLCSARFASNPPPILQYARSTLCYPQRKKCSFLRFFHSLRAYRPIYI